MMDTEHLKKIVLAALRIRPWSLYTDPDPHLQKRFWYLDLNLEVYNPQTISNKMKWKLTNKRLTINKKNILGREEKINLKKHQ